MYEMKNPCSATAERNCREGFSVTSELGYFLYGLEHNHSKKGHQTCMCAHMAQANHLVCLC